MLMFPDGIVFLAESEVYLGQVLNCIKILFREEFRLKINKSQTKVMKRSRN